jgi:aminoglycoside 3-N-acetyltransferase
MEGAMITYRDLVASFRALDLARSTPLVVHASLAAFGELNGGVDTLIGALMATFDPLMMPVFTTRTLLIPEVGPADNGMAYGSGKVSNASAEFFRPDLPADRAMGVLAESLRRLPQAQRSTHPVLSFTGVNCAAFLASQTLSEPLEPLRLLLEAGGWVLLMGVDHTANVSLHLAENLVGRKQFMRWALTPPGVVECPNMPGCSQGFNAIAPRLRRVARQAQTGEIVIQAVPMADLINIARAWLEADPLALLCDRPDCGPCQAIRAQIVRV